VRVFGGAGLAASRLALGTDTLVTVAHDHVVLRTPTQPHWRDGNALHLLRTPSEVATWLKRFADTVGNLPGVGGPVVAWEVDGATVDLPDLPPGVRAELRPVTRLADTASVRSPYAGSGQRTLAGDVEVVVADAGSDDRVWAGARALMLHAGRGKDTDWWRWHMAQEQSLSAAGRGHVLVGYRQEVPVARAALWHDGGGLAVLSDLVVHPLHRGGGVGRAIVDAAVGAHVAAGHQDDEVLCVGGLSGQPPDGWERKATIVEISAT
jgi:GNAT superfamily N-acetyltransferase